MPNPLRYRPYRAVLWVLFLLAAFGVGGLVISAGVHGVLRERDLAGPAPSTAPMEPAACAQELVRLYREIHAELDAQRAQGPTADDAHDAQAWATLRAQAKALGLRCGLEGPGKPAEAPLARAYQKILALQRLSEAAAGQYRQEVGPTDRDARKQLGLAGAHFE